MIFFIETRPQSSFKDLAQLFKEQLGTGDNSEVMIAHYLRIVRQCYQVHITWNPRRGFVVRDWGIFSKGRLLKQVAAELGKKRS